MGGDVIVLDTHVLLWWALDPGQLSKRATAALREMEQEGGYASSVSIWELGIKIERRKLELPLTIEEFARRIERGGIVELVPVDTRVWLRSLSLDWVHPDPADRVIVATALIKQVPVLSKDRAVRSCREVATVW
jgi:PIN domain nuclease of toxin-antitoxin system